MAVSHKTLSAWYLQMAQILESGFALPQALSTSSGPPQKSLVSMSKALQGGQSWDNVLRGAPRWLPQLDRYLLSAGAETGRLPDVMRGLAEKHANSAKHVAKVILASLYPVMVLHLAAILFPLLNLVEFSDDGGVLFHFENYGTEVFLYLGPLWGFLAFVYFIYSMLPAVASALSRTIPLIRGYRKAQSLADFVYTLKMYYVVGASMEEAWFGAGLISRDSRLKKGSERVSENIRKGLQPAALLGKLKCFPADFISLYLSGSQTGQLDKSLELLQKTYQQQANGKVMQAGIIYPILMTICLAVYVGIKIISFYGSMLKPIYEMLD